MNIDTSCSNIGCYEYLNRILLKRVQCFGALSLLLVAVNRRGRDAVFGQLFNKVVGAVFSPAEDQCLSCIRTKNRT